MRNRTAPRAARRDWYEIKMAAKDEAEVYIYGPIVSDGWFENDVEAAQFVKDFGAIKASTIHLRINSPGGEVFAAVAIHGAIRRHPSHTIAHIDGLAASAASFVALAADEVRMAKGGFYMIHNGWGFVMGDKSDMRHYADLLEKTDGTILGFYEEKTRRDRAEIREWMEAETWFTAEEALDAGFVDQIEEMEPVEASFDLSGFEKVPAALRGRRAEEPPRKIETVRDLENFLRDEGGFSNAAAKKAVAAIRESLSEPRDEDDASDEAALEQLSAAILNSRLALATR